MATQDDEHHQRSLEHAGDANTQRVRRAEDEAEWLRVTLFSISDGVISTDAGGRVAFMNAMAEKLTGWPAGAALGLPLDSVFRVFDEQTREQLAPRADQPLRGQPVAPATAPVVLAARDGCELPIDHSAAPIRDEAGRIIGSVVIFRDVTERRSAERELRKSAALHSAILETALDCIVTIDHAGRIVEFNPAAERTFGRRREDVLGQQIAEIVPALRARPHPGLAHDLATGEGPALGRRIELPAMRADGHEFPVELAITRIPSDGPPIFTASLRDISERKRLEHELDQRVAELAAAEQSRSEFLASLSHELRSPLNAIRLWLEMLKRKDENPEAGRRAIDVIDRQSRALADMLSDLMDVHRIASGKVRLETEEIELTSVVQTAVQALLPSAEEKQLELRVEIGSGPTPVLGDATRLQQVLWNLLSNSIKFTPPGGRITVVVRRVAALAEVEVRDSGEGISAEALPQLFERFRQADPSTSRVHSGLGLGLAIAKQLVELHGGTIRAASAGKGEGATFTFTLPLRA